MLKRGFQFAPGYRLQEFLGRGQFGQVWRATAPGGAASAAKFIDLSDGQGEKEYAGVKRVKQIRHANLMPITAIWLLDAQGKVIEEEPDEAIQTIDVSVIEAAGQSAVYRAEVEPSWLVVTMLLGGMSLQQRLRECIQEGLPGIPPKELISYMDESAKGIDFLNSPQHDLGEGPIAIQHSDIKPANIVLIGNSAVVCDFGLARILTRNQVTATSAAGTPAYMAPEAISGKPCRTSDQYSLAVTYYHLRTGTLPVNDGSLWEVLDAHRQGNLKLGLVPEAEQEVLRKATDLNWENRFASNVEMVDALREALRVEGHTKPGFVPQNSGIAAPVGGGETRAVNGDPTATLEITDATSNQAMQETAPFGTAEKSTKEQGFLKETLPELREKAATAKSTETQSAVELFRQNPKTVVGVAAGLLVLIVAAAIGLRPDSGSSATLPDNNPVAPPGTTPDPGPKPVPNPAPVVTQNPEALIGEAITLLGSDEKGAIAKFARAMELDPGFTPPVTKLSGHSRSVMWMLETPDGSTLISVAEEGTPFLWNLTSGSDQPTSLKGHENLLNAFAISPSGERLLTGGMDRVPRVWNLKASDVSSNSLELKGHNGTIEAAAWHPEGKIVATASQDTTLGVWQIGLANEENPSGTVTKDRRVPVGEQLRALVSDSDGKWLAARSIGSDPIQEQVDVLVYPWDQLIELDNSPDPIRLGAKNAKKIAFVHGEGDWLVVTGDVGGTISLYAVAEAKLQDRMPNAHHMDVDAMQVKRVDQRDVIVTGSADGSVHWWKYGGTSESRRREFCQLGIGSVDVSTDGRWVAAGANDGSVWLWDTSSESTDSGAIQFVTGSSSVDSVLIDNQSQWLIAGCDDGVIRMWDLKLAKLMALAKPTTSSMIENPIEIKSPQFSMR